MRRPSKIRGNFSLLWWDIGEEVWHRGSLTAAPSPPFAVSSLASDGLLLAPIPNVTIAWWNARGLAMHSGQAGSGESASKRE